MTTKSAALLGVLALSLAAGSASASVIYVADVQLLHGTLGLPTTVGPFDPNQPSYYFGNSFFLEVDDYSSILPDASTLSPVQFPAELKTDDTSLAARVGANSKDGLTYFTGTRGLVYEFNSRNEAVDDSQALGNGIRADSIATRGSRQVTIIAETGAASPQGYVVDFAADTVTHVFSLDGTDHAFYQNYAPNGLLYVLDYGNRRMLMLDPAQGFAQTGEFPLTPGVAIANEPFGIGANGNVYLGDGFGGGSAYSSTGAFLSTFGTPPDFTPGDSFDGAAYLFAESDGSVYVVDPPNGAVHKYLDVTETPEPSTLALVFLGVGPLLASIYRCRKRNPDSAGEAQLPRLAAKLTNS